MAHASHSQLLASGGLSEPLRARLDIAFMPKPPQEQRSAPSSGMGRRSSISAAAAATAAERRKSVVLLAGAMVASVLSGNPEDGGGVAGAGSGGGGSGGVGKAATAEGASTRGGSKPIREESGAHPASVVIDEFGYMSQQDINELMTQTGYSRRELYAMFAQFKALCALSSDPSGIDRDTFRRNIPLLSIEDDAFVQRIFELLDTDGSQKIEWEEFLVAMQSLEKGTRETRTEFLFKAYDTQGSGVLTPDELYEYFVSAMHASKGSVGADAAAIMRDFSNRVFRALDKHNTGKVSVRDVVAYVQDHPEVHDVADVFGRSMIHGHAPIPKVDYLEETRSYAARHGIGSIDPFTGKKKKLPSGSASLNRTHGSTRRVSSGPGGASSGETGPAAAAAAPTSGEDELEAFLSIHKRAEKNHLQMDSIDS